ncbi:MAG: hypothetical protein ABSH48_22800 [Verrucomicrobiota bacterium]
MRIICLVLAVLVVYELAGMVARWNPFRGVTVPELPGLTGATNGPPGTGHDTNPVAGAIKGTNRPQPPMGSSPVAAGNTNLPPHKSAGQQTNSMVCAGSTLPNTNLADITGPSVATNIAMASKLDSGGGSNSSPPMLSANGGTNALTAAVSTGTNAPAASKPKKSPAGVGPNPGVAGMNSNLMQPPGKPGADLPPAIQARIARITESEILAPVMHPQPMALLGIAGEFAFLRAASGQTGLVKEGDSLDDLKLLRIGINRVLIEQDGQKKELMIFAGYGGDSLMPKDSSNETNHP